MSTPATVPTVEHWIDGAAHPGTGGRTGDVFDPATGEVTKVLALASPEDVDAAVASAAAAFPAWRDTSLARRTQVLFAFRELPRAGLAAAHAQAHYESHAALAGAGLDALVVTGCEPVAPDLVDEPFYACLSAVVDWAADNTVSTLFSCLASHAAGLLLLH